MRKWMMFAAVMMILLPVTAFGFGGCEENCQKCHSLSTDEVKQIVTKLGAADATPLEVKMSPVKGLWEVSIEDKGNQGIMYVGFSKNHVVAGPIFEVNTALNKTMESVERMRQEHPQYVDVSKIPTDKALVVGDRDAKYRVLVFTDPDCPFCAKAHEEMKKVVAERKDIAFYLKLMPLSFHPDAYWKSQSILCNKSLFLLEDNFVKKEIPKPDCDDATEIEGNIMLAQQLGITGTPTLIMPDGMLVIGARDAKTLIEIVLNPKEKGEPR